MRSRLCYGVALAAALVTTSAGAAPDSPACTGSACATTRPGEFLELPYRHVDAVVYQSDHVDGVGCTVGFAFTDRQRRRYVSTAGHCSGVPLGTEAVDAQRRPVGRLVFVAADQEHFVDFALVQLYPTTILDPSVEGVGTPTSIFTGQPRTRTDLLLRGQGYVVSALGLRSGFTLTMESPDFVRMVAPVVPGDSGGPVLTADGQAVGVLAGYTGGPNATGVQGGSADPGTVYALRLEPLIRRVEGALHRELFLAH
jgi:hypothetical protein